MRTIDARRLLLGARFATVWVSEDGTLGPTSNTHSDIVCASQEADFLNRTKSPEDAGWHVEVFAIDYGEGVA